MMEKKLVNGPEDALANRAERDKKIELERAAYKEFFDLVNQLGRVLVQEQVLGGSHAPYQGQKDDLEKRVLEAKEKCEKLGISEQDLFTASEHPNGL